MENGDTLVERIKILAADLAANYSVNTEEEFSVKGVALGALYSLFRAAELKYIHRTGAALPDNYGLELDEIAAALGRGEGVTEGQWLAGFYFNSGLQRIAAGYHRSLQVLTQRPQLDVRELASIAMRRERLPADDLRWLDIVYGEVRKFDQDRHGLLKGRTVSLSEAVLAAEQLVELVKRAKSK